MTMKRFRLFALLAAFALSITATPAAAQDLPYADRGDEFWNRLENQLAHAVDSMDPTIRTEAARHIIYFTTYYPEQAHFRKAAPKLLNMYQFSRDESHRVLAVAALNAVGDHASMQYLSQIVSRERHPLVRQVAIATLVDYQKRTAI